MVSKKLEQLVRERKQQAISKNFLEKSDVIARELKNLRGDNHYSRWGYEFKYGGLEIDTHTWGNRAALTHDELTTYMCQISYNGEEVFSATVPNEDFQSNKIDIDLYVPGGWEDKLEKLYNRANKKIEKRDGIGISRETEEENKLRKKFGL